jgi:heme/copper-type cytochrome/quinol oxidase subunit 4
MDFYQYTQGWLKGELFEGTIVFISGILLVVISLLFWKYGTTPNAQSLVIPIMVVGLLFAVGIGFMIFSNQQRVAEFKEAYQQSSIEFVKSEKQRVEDFQVLYKYSVGFAAISFFLTIVAFGFMENRTFQSICIALMIIAVSLIVIDHFSKERAATYYQHILLELDKK